MKCNTRCAAFAMVLAVVAACGGEDRPEGACVPSSSDSYLPFEVGNAWTYEVTDLSTFETSTKSQSVAMEMNHPDDGMPVLVQVTNKANGTTESWFRREGDALVRLFLEERDEDGLFKSASTFAPSKLRLDEAPARLAQGASFTEDYSETVLDENGTPIMTTAKTELWEVLEASVACPGDEFADLDCVHVRRTRTVGGVGLKEFWFSRGVGKVREEGGQVEQLSSCSL